MLVDLAKIKEAAQDLEGVIHKTDLTYSKTFSKLSNNQIYLKTENLQKTGSFKIRGAYNKITNLTKEEQEKGVIASSAGNHAQGVALGARKEGIQATIVMPENAPIAKVTATENYGAEVILHGNVFDDAYDKAMELKVERGMTFLHPFNDPDVIAGQGTIGLEIISELKDVDIILAPVGGGGLISGIAIAAKTLKPSLQVIGVESDHAASMKYSLEQGEIKSLEKANTIADGIAVKKPGNLTYQVCQEYVDRFVTVSDEEISNAILMLLERAKLTVEGAGATTLAAVLNNKLGVKDKKIATVLSGGNIDMNMISRIIERGLTRAGRKVRFKTVLKDQPGNLQQLLNQIAKLKANVISVTHNHHQVGIPIDRAEVELELETRNQKHAQKIYQSLEDKGYQLLTNI
ncbi:threonine dehydratase, medium form [Halobacteroides halobius DSM 5150]|uniref:L-threonine dehydratase catabolic TdcB n=1 Tax=Halobacteroides halobius (strain ATCC 35273 / DSM 5150 / MD-1) TaxID=748449 RepID=L0KAQ5_HALHC|nr:threonine ammonia-lyase [Halobacteroides halobius]AGB42362.1 threonine dehydratase, medium form [Halobacteroides halobius DSM 5150]